MKQEKFKILVVDDEPDIVDVLKDFLEIRGYSVTGASSGEDALDIMEKQGVDLVLLDIRMPGLKGNEVAKVIKQQYPLTKIIALTGYPGSVTDTLLENNIFNYVFVKPVRIRVLIDKILEILVAEEDKNLYEKLQKPLKQESFLIKAKLLFLESSLEVYKALETHFKNLSAQGEHYLMSVATNREKIADKIKNFNPDIVLLNASFFREHGEGIIKDILDKSLYSKEVLIYNILDLKGCDEEKLAKLTKNVKLTCDLQ